MAEPVGSASDLGLIQTASQLPGPTLNSQVRDFGWGEIILGIENSHHVPQLEALIFDGSPLQSRAIRVESSRNIE